MRLASKRVQSGEGKRRGQRSKTERISKETRRLSYDSVVVVCEYNQVEDGYKKIIKEFPTGERERGKKVESCEG